MGQNFVGVRYHHKPTNLVLFGAIDDLWEMGKPVGHGGRWKNSAVKAGVPSDPYLIGYYDKKSLEISHESTDIGYFDIDAVNEWHLAHKVLAKKALNFTRNEEPFSAIKL